METSTIKKKMSFKTAYFPTKCHFSQMSRRNADNKLIWEKYDYEHLDLKGKYFGRYAICDAIYTCL